MLYSHISDLSLPSEIVLLVIEAMEYDPKLPGKLMSVSKEFRDLVRANKGSLSTGFARQFQEERRIPARFLRLSSNKILHQSDDKLASSAQICSPFPRQLFPRTFPWVEELHRRSILTNELVSNLSKDMINTVNRFCPNLKRNVQYSKKGLQIRVEDYHRWTIGTLFRIFDARHDQCRDRRQTQEDIIKSFSISELASLILMIHGMGMYYVETLPASSTETIGLQRETNCIYRELELRYGPCFVWVSLYGTHDDRLGIVEHVKKGLDELAAFESSNGATTGQLVYGRSLQSVLMKEFCKKRRCNGVSEAWDAICDDVVDLVLLPQRTAPKHSKVTVLKIN